MPWTLHVLAKITRLHVFLYKKWQPGNARQHTWPFCSTMYFPSLDWSDFVELTLSESMRRPEDNIRPRSGQNLSQNRENIVHIADRQFVTRRPAFFLPHRNVTHCYAILVCIWNSTKQPRIKKDEDTQNHGEKHKNGKNTEGSYFGLDLVHAEGSHKCWVLKKKRDVNN